MGSLFKYLPAQYADHLLNGEILCRNLVYFRKIEGDPRADISEGTHIDAPHHDVQLMNMTTGQTITGRFAYHNVLKNLERVFCFCTSRVFSPELVKFGGTCIQIHKPNILRQRLEIALKRRNRLSRLEQPILLAQQIEYFAANREAPPTVDIKNPRHLPFLKREIYSDEKEFRFVFARQGGYEIKQMIVNRYYKDSEEIVAKEEQHIIVRIGSIRDITSVVTL